MQRERSEQKVNWEGGHRHLGKQSTGQTRAGKAGMGGGDGCARRRVAACGDGAPWPRDPTPAAGAHTGPEHRGAGGTATDGTPLPDRGVDRDGEKRGWSKPSRLEAGSRHGCGRPALPEEGRCPSPPAPQRKAISTSSPRAHRRGYVTAGLPDPLP